MVQEPTIMKPTLSVSIVIPTYNAEQYLPSCLKAIASQDYPKNKIEILIVDGGSTDKTVSIARSYQATIIHNPAVFQEPGKTLGTQHAKGDIVLYLDADNIILGNDWLQKMLTPFSLSPDITGCIPQPIPDPHAHPIDQYFGYMFTDPFTSFVYGYASNPHTYHKIYSPRVSTAEYTAYSFPKKNLPLFGFAQGVAVRKKFGHGAGGYSDDMLSGIYAMTHGKLIAYVPTATLYHHHIESISEYLRKYSWRVKNNLKQQYTGVGIRERTQFLSYKRRLRMYLFPFYAFSIIFPLFDSLIAVTRYRSTVLLLHLPLSLGMAGIIILEYLRYIIAPTKSIGHYE